MDDSLQVIIYIVFLAIYIISRALKSKKKPLPSKPREEIHGDTETEEAPPLSFEDILRELTTGQKSQRREPLPQKSKVPDKREYEFNDDVPDDDEIQEVYEESVRKAKAYKTIDEIVELDDTSLVFKEYEKEKEEDRNPFAREIRSMLQNPEDARKAIILKEILDRKF